MTDGHTPQDIARLIAWAREKRGDPTAVVDAASVCDLVDHLVAADSGGAGRNSIAGLWFLLGQCTAFVVTVAEGKPIDDAMRSRAHLTLDRIDEALARERR